MVLDLLNPKPYTPNPVTLHKLSCEGPKCRPIPSPDEAHWQALQHRFARGASVPSIDSHSSASFSSVSFPKASVSLETPHHRTT